MMTFPFGFRTIIVFGLELVLGDPVVSVIGLEHTYALCAYCAQAFPGAVEPASSM